MKETRDNERRLIGTSVIAEMLLREANQQLGTNLKLESSIKDLPVDVFAELMHRINAHSFVKCSPNR